MSVERFNPIRRIFQGRQPDLLPVLPPTYGIREIGLKASYKLLASTQIYGEPLSAGKKEKISLTPRRIKDADLEPRFQLHISQGNSQGKKVYVSWPYEESQKRYAFMAYVEDQGEVTVRTFVQSYSSGLWRYFPYYIGVSYDGSRIGHYGKGYGEESLALPWELQRSLSEISRHLSPPVKVDKSNFFLCGTTYDLNGEEEELYKTFPQMRGQVEERKRKEFWKLLDKKPISYFNHQVSPAPKKLHGNFYPPENSKNAPESLVFDAECESPDFSEPISSWRQRNSVYGWFRTDVYLSRDNTLIYIFNKDEKQRAWISSVQTLGKLTPTGLIYNWVYAGDLTTPAFEYGNQTHGYENCDLRDQWTFYYVDMFKNYTSKIPVVKEYLQSGT